MRIAHVITRMIIGGAQENTLYTCEGLHARYGDDVLLITGPSEGPEGDLLRRRPAAFDVVEIPSLCRAIHPWRDWRSLRAIRRELVRFRPDVVHTHSAKGGVLGRLAGWAERIPAVVHTVHGSPFHPQMSPWTRVLYRWAERYAAARCHRLISVADAMTEVLVEAKVAPQEKFVTIYSGMEVEPFLESAIHREATRAELGFGPDDVVIGKIARLFELKGHEFVIAAARQVVQQAPTVRFLFVGDGVLRDELQRRVREQGLEDHFVFAGLVPPTEIPRMLAAMDLLVHTSLREGLARALPQALLAGKPVVSYDIDGAREVVLDGETGRLLPPLEIAPLAEALAELATDGALRERLGSAGRTRFTDQFRHETMTARIREVYQQLLG